ncbi:hypothetical protein ACF9IK_04755 [Kitasatospora hibisci]|uniref:hypothetical protein n=1 Tax=Kitasatospora hibisci TaxID=3369522 RepID=UPI003754047B
MDEEIVNAEQDVDPVADRLRPLGVGGGVGQQVPQGGALVEELLERLRAVGVGVPQGVVQPCTAGVLQVIDAGAAQCGLEAWEGR